MLSSQNMNDVSHHRRDTGAIEIFAWFTFAALFLFSAAVARPQAQHGTHEAAVRIPSEILERPVPLRHGIGNVHEEVTTSSPEAQGFYDQGLAYLRDSGNLQKYFAYRQIVGDALAASPKDPWLWILRGFADEGSPLAHGQGGGIDTIAFYEMALKFSPGNFVAHHYLA